jgi:hypothetical protein
MFPTPDYFPMLFSRTPTKLTFRHFPGGHVQTCLTPLSKFAVSADSCAPSLEVLPAVHPFAGASHDSPAENQDCGSETEMVKLNSLSRFELWFDLLLIHHLLK